MNDERKKEEAATAMQEMNEHDTDKVVDAAITKKTNASNNDNNENDNIENDNNENGNGNNDDDNASVSSSSSSSEESSSSSSAASSSASAANDNDEENKVNAVDNNISNLSLDNSNSNNNNSNGNANATKLSLSSSSNPQQFYDDDGHELSEYERLRLERIRRNKEKLAQLGLLNNDDDDVAGGDNNNKHHKKKRTSLGKKQQQQQQQQQQQHTLSSQDDQAPPRLPRSSLSRSSKRNVNYAELGPRWSLSSSNKETNGGGDGDQPTLSTTNNTMIMTNDSSSNNRIDNQKNNQLLPPTFASQQRPPAPLDDAQQPSHHHQQQQLTATATTTIKPAVVKKPRMAKFIYREFQRIQTLQQHTLKQAKRHCRWAKGHVHYWHKMMEKYQRHLERLAQQEERKQYGGKTLKDLLREIDARQPELLQAARAYDQRLQTAEDKAKMELQRQEAAKKREIVDALDRFPKVMKRSIVGLNKVLLERSPRDPPAPRRSKRKTIDGTTSAGTDSATAAAIASTNNNDEMDDVEENLLPPMKKQAKSMTTAMALAATAATTDTTDTTLPTPVSAQSPVQQDAGQAGGSSELPVTSSKKRTAKNVGGWVSPQFAQEIDRRWLERDAPETKAFRLETYVPQVGDTVLYYPEGHRIFLKAHPDVLGKQTRAIMRLPLWVRVRKEQLKKTPKHQQRKQKRGDGDDDEAEEVANEMEDHAQDTTVGAVDATPNAASTSVTTATTITSKTQQWWTEEWLRSIENNAGVHPIICRVEKTQAEFPSDPHADKVIKKDTENGNIQVTWKQKAADGSKRRDRRPPLCLAVTLRALMPISSTPSGGESQSHNKGKLMLPPKFTVVTFPSTVARPFLVPFGWGYRKCHTLALNARVAVQSPLGMTCNVTGAKVIGFEHPDCRLEALRLDDHIPLLTKWFVFLKLNLESTPQTIFDTLSQDFYFRKSIAPYPLVDALSVVETWMHAVKHRRSEADGPAQEGVATHTTSESISEFDFKLLVENSLPLWNGVAVARDAYDRRRHSFSPWDLDIQLPSQPKSSTKVSRNFSSIDNLPVSLDSSLRLKVEMTLEDFLKGNKDAEVFSPLVLDSEAPSYSCAVPLGMAFDRILCRLTAKAASNDQSYYRHAEAILSDIGLIEDNCLLYNSPDAEIVERAGQIVTEAKRQVAQVVSDHTRELDSRLKEVEQRHRSVHRQRDSLIESKQPIDDSSAMQRHGLRKALDTNEMFTPFKDSLYRDWLQDFEADGSWTSMSNRAAPKSLAGNSVNGLWIPQTGDRVFYSESAHAKFLRAHYHSLTNEQCELPQLSQTPEIDKNLQPVSNNESMASDSTQIQIPKTGWVLGTIQKVKVTFPRRGIKQEIRAGESEGFQVHSPILALDLRFEHGSCNIVTINWRPCEFNKRNLDTTHKCSRCGLSLVASFLHPAWLKIERSMTELPEQVSDSWFSTPTGLTKDDVESIDRCLNLLKRRCIAGMPPDFLDKQQCISDLKKGIFPTAKVKMSSLPVFEDIFRVEKDSHSRVGTRGVRGHGPEKHESKLAESTFLPLWAASSLHEDADEFNVKRCEMIFPCPNFSLELVQLRLSHGFYRQKAAIFDDIEEAYIQAVLFLLSGPATRKKMPLSIKKLAKLLSSKSNVARFFEPSSETPPSDTKLFKGGTVASPSKIASRNVVSEGSAIDDETLWMSRLEKIRRLHAIALVCVSETRLVELIFGTLPHQKGKIRDASNMAVVSAAQEAARQNINLVLGALGTDFCLNRFTSQLPQVRIKITCDGDIVSASNDESNDDGDLLSTKNVKSQQIRSHPSISFSIGEIRGNNSLAQLFFGRPAKMNACARCQVYQRSMLECRVVRMHSNIDFDWGVYCKELGRIDGILQQLRPALTLNVSAPNCQSSGTKDYGRPPSPSRPRPTGTTNDIYFDGGKEAPNNLPPLSNSNMPSVIESSNNPLVSEASNSPSLTHGSSTPSLAEDSPTPKHFNRKNIAAADHDRTHSAEENSKGAADEIMDEATKGNGLEAVVGKDKTGYTDSEAAQAASAGEHGAESYSDIPAVAFVAVDNIENPSAATNMVEHSETNLVSSTAASVTNKASIESVGSNKRSKAQAVISDDANGAKNDSKAPVVISDDFIVANNESRAPVVTSEAADAAERKSQTEAVTFDAVDATEKESETTVDPREELDKSMLAARMSSELFVQAKAAADVPARLHPDFIRAYFPVDPEDGHYIFCVVCGLSGDLLCCDGCPNVLHQQCARLSEIPEGDWFCATCSRKVPPIVAAGELPKEGTTPAPDERANKPDFEETWTKKFIGTAPFDFEKENELVKILEELRLLRIKSLPPSAQNSDAVDNPKTVPQTAPVDEERPLESAPSSGSVIMAAKSVDRSSNTLPQGFIQIGFVITKDFKAGTFTGKVVSLPSQARPFYRIQYDDGDEEDMSSSELQDHLPLYTLKKLKALQQRGTPSISDLGNSDTKQIAGASNDEPTSRPRGRPRKSEVRPDPVVLPKKLSASSRKSHHLESSDGARSMACSEPRATTSQKPKYLEQQLLRVDPAKKRRGRPRKHPLPLAPAPPPPVSVPSESPLISRVEDLEEQPIVSKHRRLS